MTRLTRVGCAAGAIALALTSITARSPAGIESLRHEFKTPPDAARIMMRWWWFGAAVTPAQVTRDLDAMKAAGIGGVEIQPVYPLTPDEPSRGVRNLPFLSSEFLDVVRAANTHARNIGLRVDLTLGSGWPYGGPSVPIDEAAGRLRWERVRLPAGAARIVLPSAIPAEQRLAVFVGPAGEPDAASSGMRPIVLPADGDVLTVEPAPREREVWVFLGSRTGMQVKRPSVGAEGFVLDHYSRAALDSYLQRVGTPLLSAFENAPPSAIFCDSFEVYESDWSSDFLPEFHTRRGYDLTPMLPALVAGTGADAARLREDWGRTLTELVQERFVAPLAAWAAAHRTRLRAQAYGIPPATISTSERVDLPEGEGADWQHLTASRWAASASHIFSRPVASAETWTWLHSPAFRATPLDMKAEADRQFLQGITQLVGHGWPSTPDGEAYPGWRFYAAGAFNDRNPWWIVMPDLSRYLQRVSHLLRQGRPLNTVGVYLPVQDAYAHAAPGKFHLLDLLRERLGPDILGSILDAGYGVELIDDDALIRTARLEGQELVVGSSRLGMVVLPAVEAMPLETLQRLAAFAGAGGRVIAARQPPQRPPGRAGAADAAAFARQAASLFTAPDARGRVAADDGVALRVAMREMLPPPIAIAADGDPRQDGRALETGIGVVGRDVDGVRLFFTVNTTNTRKRVRALPGPGSWQWWNPVTGEIADARGPDVRLDLAPYQSGFLVRVSDAPSRLPAARAGQPEDLRTIGPWAVHFDDIALTKTMATPASWDADEETKYYSGTASYEARVDLSARDLGEGSQLTLDFGEGLAVPEQPRRLGMRAWLDPPIRDAAVVHVNGVRAGALWCPPYRLDVTRALRAGANIIRIQVGNTAMNHMAGHPAPSYRLLNLRYGERFQAQDMDQVMPLPSGLVAPVQLRRARVAR